MLETGTDAPRQERELAFICELTKKALGLESLHEFWPLVEAELIGFFACDRATLYLVDKAELRSMFARGLANSVTVKLGDGVAGHVAINGRTVIVNDPYKDDRFNPVYDRATGYKTENLACGAFLHENQAVGVVELMNRRGGFSPEDSRSLDWFAPHIGFIIAKLLADQKNREMQQNLAQVTKMAALGMLVSGTAHELGTPMTIMQGAAERLTTMVPPDSPLLAEFERIRHQAVRCQAIVKNLLDFARKTEFRQQAVSVADQLKPTLDLVEHQARLQGVAIEARVPAGLPSVKAGANQLQQVFLNLVVNGLQAMPLGGKLAVTAQAAEGTVLVRFRDDGEGIDPGDLARIFEPFFTTRPSGFGTGLGLSICKDLVERFGGTLTARSDGKGRGAEFTVLLKTA